jgi:hypothetical protein
MLESWRCETFCFLSNSRLTGGKVRTKRKKSGLYGLMSKVSTRGLSALDKRSAGSRALQEWRVELERDLGNDLSAQQRCLVELVTRTRLYLDFVDGYILTLDSVVVRRRKTVIPILLQRMALSDSLARLLTQLGLQRKMPRTPSLQEYLASKESEASEVPENSAGEAVQPQSDDSAGETP